MSECRGRAGRDSASVSGTIRMRLGEITLIVNSDSEETSEAIFDVCNLFLLRAIDPFLDRDGTSP